MPKASEMKDKKKSIMKKHIQKIKKAKNDDPELYKKSVRIRNRAKRRYKRKKRVGKDPKKILKRYKKILFELRVSSRESSFLKKIISKGNLDHQIRIYKGSSESENVMWYANIVDLLQEMVELSQKCKIYASLEYSKQLKFIYNGQTVSVPFPKDIEDLDNVMDVNGSIIIECGGTLYHGSYKEIIPSEKCNIQIIAIYPKRVENPHPANIVTLSKFLEEYGLTEDKLN